MKAAHLAPVAGALLALVFAGCSDDGKSSAGTSSAPEEANSDGLWHDVQQGEALPDELEDLAALPYLGGDAALEADVVTQYVMEDAADGMNLVVSAHAQGGAEVTVRDMKNGVRHTWKATPSLWPASADPVHRTYIRRAHLLPTGELVALFEGIGIAKLARDGQVVWKYAGTVHDDLTVDDAGAVHTLLDAGGEDFVLTLDAGGNEAGRVSIHECVSTSDFAEAKPSGKATGARSIEWLDGSSVGEKGNVLVSLDASGSVVVLDLGAKNATWAVSGLQGPRDASATPSGQVLVFEGGAGGNSRVSRIDASGEATWSYENSELTPLRSASAGACQALANGNVLITECEGGRAFEVPEDKLPRWHWQSPYGTATTVASLCEMVRLPTDYVEKALDLASASAEIDTGGLEGLLNNKGGEGK